MGQTKETPDERRSIMHPNVKRLETFLEAYSAGDDAGIRDCLADDAVWHVGGTHRLSGDYRGASSILEYFGRVNEETGGTLRLDRLELLANDKRGAAFLRVIGERRDQQLDVTMAEAFQFDDNGQIKEFWAHATDQDAINQFWS
jgi:ketosteroid isomerase-like protein